MEVSKLSDMTGGWIVGDFEPTLIHSTDIEVAVKHYSKGTLEPKHHHKIAEELTLIAAGEARMGGTILKQGDIARIAPGESTDFEALQDTITVVVKTPSASEDKYLDEN